MILLMMLLMNNMISCQILYHLCLIIIIHHLSNAVVILILFHLLILISFMIRKNSNLEILSLHCAIVCLVLNLLILNRNEIACLAMIPIFLLLNLIIIILLSK